MVFSSYTFILGFMPLTLLGWLMASRFGVTPAKMWLCAASLVFYGWWYIGWLPVLLISIAFNYFIGHLIITRTSQGRDAKEILLAGVAVDLAALFYYKYMFVIAGFFSIDLSGLAASGLPLGISFFTFTQIAFLVDVSQGFAETYSPLNYLLFVTFFPHLIAGPIVHHRELMPQFEDKRNYRFQPMSFAIGLAIFSIGLAKKTLIADSVGQLSVSLLDHGHGNAMLAWIGMLAYSMQLYFDFSGYSDMAIGLARLFGVKFPINFDSPYKATSIIEFWQRWHITLTRFLTAYVYNPTALQLVRRRARAGLSMSKRVSATFPGFAELIALPTFTTMLLSGIWHGAGLTFIVFGALHGLYISVNHAWRTFGPKYDLRGGTIRSRIYLIASGMLVYGCVLLAQIFFRAESVTSAFAVFSDMLNVHELFAPRCWPWALSQCSTGATAGVQDVALRDLAFLGGAMLIAWLAPNTQEIMASYEPALNLSSRERVRPLLARLDARWACVFGVVLFLGCVSIRDGQPFIYFQF